MVSAAFEPNLAALSCSIGEAAHAVSIARDRTKKLMIGDIVEVSGVKCLYLAGCDESKPNACELGF